MAAAVAYRLTPRWRLHAGAGHNTLAPGARAGVTVRLRPRGAAPIAAAELGRFAPAAPGWLTAAVDDDSLHAVGYDYASFELGFELGGPAADATFFALVGASAIAADLYFEDRTDAMLVRSRSTLSFTTLSGRMGVLVWF